MWVEFNANPQNKHIGDCTVRAISFALGVSWEDAFIGLATEGLVKHDMPSSNSVWGQYLRQNGFSKKNVKKDIDYTLTEFCDDHPSGMFVVALPGHVVAVNNGNYYDTWDSGGELPLYYWQKENKT